MPNQTMEQARMLFVRDQYVNSPVLVRNGRFTHYARQLPTMIRVNGLGQALAFALAKAGHSKPENRRNDEERAWHALYSLVSKWIMHDPNPNQSLPGAVLANSTNGVLIAITHASLEDYLAAQVEAMALLMWVKRFAEGFGHDDNARGDAGGQRDAL